MIRQAIQEAKLNIDTTISNFWKTNDGGEYKSGLCGEFAVALGETFTPSKYFEIYSDSYNGIHYFISFKGGYYDVNGWFPDADTLITMNEYYMADYPGLTYKEVKKSKINYEKSYVKYLKDVFKENNVKFN